MPSIRPGTQQVLNKIVLISYYKNSTYSWLRIHTLSNYVGFKVKVTHLSPPPEITISDSLMSCPMILPTLYVDT